MPRKNFDPYPSTAGKREPKNQGVVNFMKTFFNCFSAVVLLAFFVCGCTSDKSAESIKDPGKFENMPHRHTKKTLPKIPTDDFELKIPYDITVSAGTSPEIGIQLAYYGLKTREIKEWYMLDAYNFEIWYRRLDAGKLNGKKVPFKKYRVMPPQGTDVNRSGLIMNRNNRAMLSMNLAFISELNPGEKALFEAYVNTTLRTFKLRSNRMLIRTK